MNTNINRMGSGARMNTNINRMGSGARMNTNINRMGSGARMNTNIAAQYSTGLSRHNIERALIAAGKDLDNLVPADLGLLEDFHTMGRIATSQLVDLAGIAAEDRVLDAGSGVGGTARFVADRCGCAVAAVDLTGEYCETNRWLNGLVGLDERISVRQADVTALPFAEGIFDVVISQHVQMNIADKARLYSETRRVLAGGGRLALWDITIQDESQRLDYPLPWADQPERSHLVTSDELRAIVDSAGLAVEHWNDLTDEAAALMQAMLAQPAGPLGLHAFVADFRRKAENLTQALSDGRLRAIQAVARNDSKG
jgi:SAM-dependent methyltransferase